MAIKIAETRFKAFCKRYNIWAHKWPDVRELECKTCGRKDLYYLTARTQPGDQRVPKASIVDYLCWGGKYFWVECKSTNAKETRFPFKDIEPHQRSFMDDWIGRGELAYYYIEMGGHQDSLNLWCWLIPADVYKTVEQEYRENLPKTQSWKLTDMALAFREYSLDWVNSGWKLYEQHPLKDDLPQIGKLPTLFQKE
jgi:hypothetical protein